MHSGLADPPISCQRLRHRTMWLPVPDVQGDREAGERGPSTPQRSEPVDRQSGQDGDSDKVDGPEDGDMPIPGKDRRGAGSQDIGPDYDYSGVQGDVVGDMMV